MPHLVFVHFVRCLTLIIIHSFLHCHAEAKEPLLSHLQNQNHCNNKCGSLEIPFPFYLNDSSSFCRTLSDSFSLSCVNSSILVLNIAAYSYRVIHFFPDGVLIDFLDNTSSSMCWQFIDFKSFAFSVNEYFGISTDNVLHLYDCQDSSLCKSECEKVSGCEDQGGASYPASSCCYPLTDTTAWRQGDSLSEFSRFGCRGFSSALVSPGSKTGMRGVKLEWAVPRNSTQPTCAANANALNATAVASGVRCQCHPGFYGDGFTAGVGCLKCTHCSSKNHDKKVATILAGAIAFILTIASLIVFFFLSQPISNMFVSDNERTILSTKASRPSVFTYHELEQATNWFEDGQKIVDSASATLYIGVLVGGSHVAVHKIIHQGLSERDIVKILFRLDTLSAVSHRNLARIIGCSIPPNTNYIAPNSHLMVVYDYPKNGTLKEYLVGGCRDQKMPLDWYTRLNIAVETASILAFLHHEISPPIFHHDLQTGYIFLDMMFTVKLAGFGYQLQESEQLHSVGNDVYNLGIVLLEIITGNTMLNLSTIALRKIKTGRLEEIVDPSLYYHEQPHFQREQIEKIADLATRCLLFGGDGKLGMGDVARELAHINTNDGNNQRGAALEETFSNSSLLQMISMSPDSIYVP